MKKSKKQIGLFKIVLTAMLITLNLVLERFLAYKAWNQDISFGFIAVAFAAAFLGAPYAVAVAGFGDLIGAILFPVGPFFPGFTATNCIYGLLLAEFIHKNATPLKIVLGVLINKIVCTLLLNTLWVSIVYRGGVDAFFIVLLGRLPSAAITTVVEIIVLLFVFSQNSHIRTLLDKSLKKII